MFLRRVTGVLEIIAIARFCQGGGSRDDGRAIGLTGPAEAVRSPGAALVPGTGNAYPTMVLTTQRSDAGVNP